MMSETSDVQCSIVHHDDVVVHEMLTTVSRAPAIIIMSMTAL